MLHRFEILRNHQSLNKNRQFLNRKNLSLNPQNQKQFKNRKLL
jgi:hypothetical protein